MDSTLSVGDRVRYVDDVPAIIISIDSDTLATIRYEDGQEVSASLYDLERYQ